MGLCPFHEDTEPSFAVDERKGLWNCLGKCGEGGDAFSFVMKADGIGFAEAFALLQEIEPQRRRDAEEDKQLTTDNRPQTTALEYLEKAVSYYHKSLVKMRRRSLICKVADHAGSGPGLSPGLC